MSTVVEARRAHRQAAGGVGADAAPARWNAEGHRPLRLLVRPVGRGDDLGGHRTEPAPARPDQRR